MIKFYLAVGISGFLIGLVVDWIFAWASRKKDKDDEYIKELIDNINSLNECLESKEEVIEDQQKMIALQKIAIDTYKDVLAVKEVVG